MSILNIMFGDYRAYRDRENRELYLIRLHKDKLFSWHVSEKTNTQIDFRFSADCVFVKPEDVDVDVLKELDIWDKLSPEYQQRLEHSVIQQETEVKERMEHVRKERKGREDYAHIPREITCTGCNQVFPIAPGIFVKKAHLYCEDTPEEKDKIKTFMDAFKCPTCEPKHRGRQRNPLFKDIPREIACSKCHKEIVLNSKQVYDITEGKIDKIKAYCEGYVCRSCNPEKRGRGRKPNPENIGFPKSVKCTGEGCGRDVAIVPSQIREKAKRLKVTVEDLLANYKCRSCGGVVPHKKRGRKRKETAVA